MKLFQQLLVAPAALGLMSPVAVSAAELNLNDISEYSNSGDQIQSISNFSDLYPTDWSFQALTRLAENHSCAVSIPSSAITRYEAAALLNRCLESIAQLNSEERRLVDEFAPELALIKGRINGIENSVGEFEAGAFSSTTKMSGFAYFTGGAVDGATNDKTHLQYAYGIDINTSFTGEDVLYTGIETGNSDGVIGLDSSTTGSSNALAVTSLFYTFPVSDFVVTAGPLVDQDDVVAATTTLYPETFKLAGLPYSVAGSETGPGVAVSYGNDNGFVASISHVSADGDEASKGIGTEKGDDVTSATIGYNADNWGVGLAYAEGDESDSTTAGYTAFGIGAYWAPEGYPTLSLSYDTKDPESGNDEEDIFFGLGYDWGPGTVNAAVSNIADQLGYDDRMEYELSYTYPVNDFMTITPGIFFQEQNKGSDDQTGYVIETSFTF